MSRSVKFRRASPSGHYDHQRSDSGFSDCESRASNPDHDYLVPGFEDPGIYSIRKALDEARQETEKWKAKADDLEEKLKETRNDFEQAKARMRAIANETQVLVEEKESLAKTNKELLDQNAELQATVKELKKANRKSSSGSSPSGSSATASESSDEKKVRRSSSRRPKESGRADKEKERGREREKEREKERDKERDREWRKEKERAALEETERLRKRFDTRGDESDAKSSTTTTKSARNRPNSNYIEPLGHAAPRPAPVPPSPSRAYSTYPATTAPAYSTAPAYASIREPFSANTSRALHSAVHPAVYVADDYTSYGPVDDEDAVSYHTQTHPRSTRHQR